MIRVEPHRAEGEAPFATGKEPRRHRVGRGPLMANGSRVSAAVASTTTSAGVRILRVRIRERRTLAVR